MEQLRAYAHECINTAPEPIERSLRKPVVALRMPLVNGVTEDIVVNGGHVWEFSCDNVLLLQSLYCMFAAQAALPSELVSRMCVLCAQPVKKRSASETERSAGCLCDSPKSLTVTGVGGSGTDVVFCCLGGRGLSPTVIRQHIRAHMNQLLRRCVARQVLSSNPTQSSSTETTHTDHEPTTTRMNTRCRPQNGALAVINAICAELAVGVKRAMARVTVHLVWDLDSLLAMLAGVGAALSSSLTPLSLHHTTLTCPLLLVDNFTFLYWAGRSNFTVALSRLQEVKERNAFSTIRKEYAALYEMYSALLLRVRRFAKSHSVACLLGCSPVTKMHRSALWTCTRISGSPLGPHYVRLLDMRVFINDAGYHTDTSASTGQSVEEGKNPQRREKKDHTGLSGGDVKAFSFALSGCGGAFGAERGKSVDTEDGVLHFRGLWRCEACTSSVNAKSP